MAAALRIPATLATKKGAGYLAEQASDRTVVLTSHGVPTAVVMSPERLDELERTLRRAADDLVRGVATLVAERSEFLTPEQARRRLDARG